jgi:CheY-like chemotaxis protein
VGNAVKFTEQGEVVVRISMECETDVDVALHFEIKDTGIGIAPDKQEAIFQAFTQADTSTTRKFGGTGLGLAISTRLVGLMRGRIWVHSEVGSGSSFHFIAHFGLQPHPGQRIERAEFEKLAGLPVLVVDDNHTNREILQKMLAGWGMKATLAKGGREALAAIVESRCQGLEFSVILLDAHMPEMDGFTLARKLQEKSVPGQAAVMMLTSGGLRGDAARCKEFGVQAYLTKPIRGGELLKAIQTVLGGVEGSRQEKPLITQHILRETHAGLRILLVEDNAVNQKVAVRTLEKRGHVVVVAGNGKAAAEATASEGFDLVLMDVQMPEMDGFEATAAIRIREQTTGRHIPIIAMTAHAMVGDKEDCLAAGMDNYVSKPLQFKELFAAIENTLNQAKTP